MKNIIGEIRKKRKELKLSQSDLAEKVGCCYVTISNFEQGNSIRTEWLVKMCEALGLELIVQEKE